MKNIFSTLQKKTAFTGAPVFGKNIFSQNFKVALTFYSKHQKTYFQLLNE